MANFGVQIFPTDQTIQPVEIAKAVEERNTAARIHANTKTVEAKALLTTKRNLLKKTEKRSRK